MGTNPLLDVSIILEAGTMLMSLCLGKVLNYVQNICCVAELLLVGILFVAELRYL